ncbi:MAG: hypothetical protein IAG10_07580 [Planctomycetaceae bacterium]|nr:hypothetical protein [Planctomycetaceae bacterium]
MSAKPTLKTASLGPALAQTADFDLLDEELAQDVESALATALRAGAVFVDGATPLAIFRQSLAAAIGRIHEDGRAALFLRFLQDGPYEGKGDIPPELQGQRLTDPETATVIGFIYSHMVNCFKGAITEMFATAPCLQILRKLQAEQRLPQTARLYVGDAVWTDSPKSRAFAKGADLHILVEQSLPPEPPTVVVAGVVEVKSYFQSPKLLRRQLDQHVSRARVGLRVGDVVYAPSQISIGLEPDMSAVQIGVLPARWTLPRAFRFDQTDHGKFLRVEPAVPPRSAATWERPGPWEWQVTLRWSKEALDSAAYEMTFWFMEKVGEALYSDGMPSYWAEMTPAEAGRNAAKMMLYYALLRCRSAKQDQQAIALYNSYGFGTALGMSFRNPEGKREMLWPQDLDEILVDGVTRSGCRIV